MRTLKFLVTVGIIVLLGMAFITCNDEDDESLSALEKSLSKSVAKSYASSLLAADTNHNYQDEQYMGNFASSECPDVTWGGVCNWTFEYGAGCYGGLGNYWSGSFGTTDCSTWNFYNFCVNYWCMNGSISFDDASTCPAAYCYTENVTLTFSDANDTVTITLSATTGTNTNEWFMYAPATMLLESANYGIYSAEVTQDLYKSPSCLNPTSGKIRITLPNATVLTLDYNTGNCNTVYVNGIELPLN